MTRQVRAEATRQAIINAAVEIFAEDGYGRASLSGIIARANVTKGAFYFHFDSKDSVARAIIDITNIDTNAACLSIQESRSPALEKLIHESFVVANLVLHDKCLRTGVRLIGEIGDFNGLATRHFPDRLAATERLTIKAIQQQDLLGTVDPTAVAGAVVSALTGLYVVSSAVSQYADLIPRLEQMWRILLPALVPGDLLTYFNEFVAREFTRTFDTPLEVFSTR